MLSSMLPAESDSPGIELPFNYKKIAHALAAGIDDLSQQLVISQVHLTIPGLREGTAKRKPEQIGGG